VADGSTETLPWQATVVRTTGSSTILVRLLGGGSTDQPPFEISTWEMDLSDGLSHRTYLPVELVDGSSASAVVVGTAPVSTSSLRIDMGGSCAVTIADDAIAWVVVDAKEVGVWATTVCRGAGSVTALDEKGATISTETITIQRADDTGVISTSVLGGERLVLVKSRGMRRAADMDKMELGPPQPAVTIHVGNSSGSLGLSAEPDEVHLINAEGVPGEGPQLAYGYAPLASRQVVIVLEDGRAVDATLVTDEGLKFQFFFAEIPGAQEGSTVFAFDGSCREISRWAWPGGPTVPIPPCAT
jgi:hypothetical protein